MFPPIKISQNFAISVNTISPKLLPPALTVFGMYSFSIKHFFQDWWAGFDGYRNFSPEKRNGVLWFLLLLGLANHSSSNSVNSSQGHAPLTPAQYKTKLWRLIHSPLRKHSRSGSMSFILSNCNDKLFIFTNKWSLSKSIQWFQSKCALKHKYWRRIKVIRINIKTLQEIP